MDINQVLMICAIIFGGLMFISLGVVFFVSRRSQQVMESLLTILTNPERTQVRDAARVLQTVLADEINKIGANFDSMRDALDTRIQAAEKLKRELGDQNDKLVATADDATKKLAQMSQRLDNTVTGLTGVVDSDAWNAIDQTTRNFNDTVTELLTRIGQTTNDTTEKTANIKARIDEWIAAGQELSKQLATEFESNTNQMKTLGADADAMNQKMAEMAKSVADGFGTVKTAATDYEKVMGTNNKLLNDYLVKLDNFSKMSKKQLTGQMNTITNTATVVAGQVRLVESSIDRQVRKLGDAVEAVMSSANATEASVRGISGELAALTTRFNNDIRGFAGGVVAELKNVSGVANNTLENTKNAAGKFSESVRAMATGVRETLIEMNTAHTQLSGQSESLIKMSAETTAQLQPLSELIEKYYTALPDLSRGSADAAQTLEKIVAGLNEKINMMQTAISDSMTSISESSIKLEDLAGQSRQQMIDLMSDYAKAVNTMQTLNKQMMVARATAPMDAIASAGDGGPAPRVSSRDFLKQSARTFEKMHDQAMDLTRATGAEIPDVVWKKYHDGDKTIFAKWLAKMLGAADKKQIRDLLKSDGVFRSQATQFVRTFDKLLNAAAQTDTADKLAATLMQTDLGRIYSALHGQL